jgi:hypothetical protein
MQVIKHDILSWNGFYLNPQFSPASTCTDFNAPRNVFSKKDFFLKQSSFNREGRRQVGKATCMILN